MADNNDRLGVEVELTPSPSKEEFQSKIKSKYKGLTLAVNMADDFKDFEKKVDRVFDKLAKESQKQASTRSSATKKRSADAIREIQKIEVALSKYNAFSSVETQGLRHLKNLRTAYAKNMEDLKAMYASKVWGGDSEALVALRKDIEAELKYIEKQIQARRRSQKEAEKEAKAKERAAQQSVKAREKEAAALEKIPVLIERIRKLQQQVNGTGIGLDLSKYQTQDILSLKDLLSVDFSKLPFEELKGYMGDLQNTLNIGNAKLSTINSVSDSATQLANLNHQIEEYIQNNSKIKTNKGLYAELYRLHSEVKKGSVSVEDAQMRWAGLRSQFAALKLETETLSGRIIHLFKDHFNTAIAMAGLHALRNSLNKVFQSIAEIDAAMTELKKVTNETDLAYEKFLDRATNKAQILGAAINDVVTATADFARLGYSLPDAEQLADAAIVYKNVGDGIDDISTASESIISTMKAFGYSAEEAMAIVDKFNYVGNNFAISSVGIGEALKRSAAALAQSNNDLAESIALVTAGNNVIQDPDAVGTALKTLSLRLSTTKTELEELGEDTDGAAESVSEYRSEILAITRAAGDEVDILNEAGDAYKSTYQILYELSKVWDDIDQKEQQSLLYLLGGARQANVLASILKNFKDAEDVVAQLSDGSADGSALEENEKYLDSIAGKLDQIEASFQALSTHAIDNEVIKGFLDLANAVIKLADGLIQLEGLIPVLTAIGTGIFAADGKKFFRDGILTGDIAGTLKNIKNSGLNSFEVYGFNHDYKADAEAIRKAAFKKKTAIGTAKALDPSILGAGVQDEVERILKQQGKSFKEIKEELLLYADALEDSTNKLSSFKTKALAFAKQAGTILAVVATFKILSKIVDEAIITEEEYIDSINQLDEKIKNVNEELTKLRELENSSQGVSSEEQARLSYLEKYVSLLEKQKQLELKDYYNDHYLHKDLNPFSDNTFEQTQNLLASESGDILYRYIDMFNNNPDEFQHGGIFENAMSEHYQQAADEVIKLNELASQYKEAYETWGENTYQGQELYSKYAEIEARINSLNNALEKAEGTGAVFLDISSPKNTDSEKIESITKTWNVIQGIKKDSKDIPDSLDWSKELQRNTGYAQLLKDKIKEIASDISITSLNEEIDSMQTSLDTVISAYQEYNAKGSYSLDTLQALTELEPRYLSLLIDEQGQLSLNEERIKDLTQARINEMRIKTVQNAISSIENLTSEAAATEYLTKAQIDLNAAEYEGAKAALALAAGNAIARGGAIEEATRAIVEQTNILLGAIGAWDGYGLSGSDALDDVAKAAEEAKKQVNDALKDQGDMMLKVLDKRKDALQDELDALEDRYEAEDKEFELQKRINAYQAAQAKKTVRLYTHDKGWQWVADPTAVKEAQDAVEEYQRELERDEAKKAIQDQIDAIDDLRDRVQDAMDSIGNEFMDSRDDLALMAELEGMTFDQLGDWAEDYARRVKAANAEVVESYDGVSKKIQGLFGTVPEDEIIPETSKETGSQHNYHYDSAGIMNGEMAYYQETYGNDFIKSAKTISQYIDELASSADIMDGEMAYYAEMAAQHGEKWIGSLEEVRKFREEDRRSDLEAAQLYYEGLNERLSLYYENAKLQGEDFALFYVERINQIINAVRSAIEALNMLSQAISNKDGNSPLPNNYIYNPTTGTAMPKFHSGGLVRGISDGANVSGEFLKYMKTIKRDEVPAVLQAGEYVLTKQNQADILNDRTALLNSVKTSRNQSIQIGDIIINQPVGNAETLSKAIIAKLPTQIMRDLYK